MKTSTTTLIPQTAQLTLPGVRTLYTEILTLTVEDLVAELTLDPLTVEPVSLPIVPLAPSTESTSSHRPRRGRPAR